MGRYGLVEFWRPRPEWYALSREEKERFVEGIRENVSSLEKRGAKLLGVYLCRGSSDWDGMAFWECPNIEMAEAVAEGSESHRWYHYFEGSNFVGNVQSLEDWVKHVMRMT